jgi:hypothetical protein
MTHAIAVAATAAMLLVLTASTADAQRPGPPGRGERPPAARQPAPPQRQWPKDKQLLDLYYQFVTNAEKLADEYEKAKDFDRARSVYEEILKVVPNHARSQKKVEEYRAKEADAKRATVEIDASGGWQDSGVRLIEGKPVTIRATGSWTINVSRKLGPEGLKASEEFKGLDLGSLIGMIRSESRVPAETSKPFAVGAQHQFRADRSGRLLLRMHDTDPADNTGTVRVEIVGTFEVQ